CYNPFGGRAVEEGGPTSASGPEQEILMKRTLLSTALVLTVALAGATANATTQMHALACQPSAGGFGALSPTSYGWTNTSKGGTSNIVCGLSTQAGDNFRGVTITVYDRSTTSDVTCEIWGLDRNGTIVFDHVTSSTGASQ